MKRANIILGLILVSLIGATYYLLQSGSSKERKRFGGGRVVTVKVEPATIKHFQAIVEAIGTAKSRESVVLAARVSDTVSAISFKDGQVVKKGDLLVSMTSDEEQAAHREALANLEEAKKQYERYNDLVKQGNASTATLEIQYRNLEQARSRLAGAEARLNDRRIVAPFDGILGLRQVSEGSLISPNAPITTIDAIDSIKLDFSVPERFIKDLASGQRVMAKVDAYQGEEFEGRVISVDTRVDNRTRTIMVRAEISNEDLRLRPGMMMTVELISREWDAIAAPEESILPSNNNHYLFVAGPDNKSERRLVELGIRRPGYVEIRSGLEEGDLIITQGLIRLSASSSKIRILGEGNDKQRKPKANRQPNKK